MDLTQFTRSCFWKIILLNHGIIRIKFLRTVLIMPQASTLDASIQITQYHGSNTATIGAVTMSFFFFLSTYEVSGVRTPIGTKQC